ncbi:MAG: hypothetical protein MUC97_11595 [Bernardetiaceae bacterium]|nr:hypothetical protein [Bernardetiaceae bacterium]
MMGEKQIPNSGPPPAWANTVSDAELPAAKVLPFMPNRCRGFEPSAGWGGSAP